MAGGKKKLARFSIAARGPLVSLHPIHPLTFLGSGQGSGAPWPTRFASLWTQRRGSTSQVRGPTIRAGVRGLLFSFFLVAPDLIASAPRASPLLAGSMFQLELELGKSIKLLESSQWERPDDASLFRKLARARFRL
jgi:hypothetical protein